MTRSLPFLFAIPCAAIGLTLLTTATSFAGTESAPSETTRQTENTPAPAAEPQRFAVAGAGAVIQGRSDAPVQMVVFVDYECPFSRDLLTRLGRLQASYGDDLTLRFAQLPLPFHHEARFAALAVHAALQQNQGLALHRALVTEALPLTHEVIVGHAQKLGLDAAQLRQANENPKWRTNLERELKVATALGIQGTPTMLINGQALLGAVADSRIQQALDAEMVRVKKLRAAGIADAEIARRLAQPNVAPGATVTAVAKGADECGGTCECDQP